MTEQEDRLNHLAHHDNLTGLPNGALFHDRLRQALAQAKRHEQALALLFLDLDGFKAINDTLGHDVGDALLKEVARRLDSCTREGDTVARLGGDEFAIILPDVTQAHDAATVARQILSLLSEMPRLAGHELHMTASIGISLYPSSGADDDSLITCADTAMYRAKQQGKSGYEFFTPDMTQQARERFALEQSLRQAISNGELVLHYQPLVEAAGGRLVAVEALVRWKHPVHGVLAPAAFVPLAEQSDLIVALTHWTLAAALRQCRAWQIKGLRLGIAVNVAIQALHDPELPATLASLLSQHGIEPARLTLDIDEAGIMTDPERARDELVCLAGMGVRIAIDDFGRSHSSLAHLKRLPIDEVKIDRSLVTGMGKDQQDAAVVCSLIGMMHALRLEVVAEGVEDEAAYKLLEAVGCDAVQGYYVSAALTAWELKQWATAAACSA